MKGSVPLEQPMSIRACVFCLAAVTSLAARSAQPVSVKDIFEKHNLIGVFAADCTKEASKQNY
jgi:hypothetical protein